MRAIASSLAIAMFASSAATAGPWPQKPGEGQVIVGVTFDEATRAYSADGEPDQDAVFRKFEVSAYIEHGVTPRLTFVARPAYQWIEIGDSVATEFVEGFAASEFGVRALVAEPFGGVVSAQASVITPGEGENVIGARLGEGGNGVEARLLAGRGWGGEDRGGFLDVQAAYLRRFDEADPDEYRALATVGVRPARGWLVMGQLSSVASSNEPVTRRPYRSHKAQASVVRDYSKRVSVEAGVFRSYAGRDVIEETAVFYGCLAAVLSATRRFPPPFRPASTQSSSCVQSRCGYR